jgi:hypothetical protein
MCSELPELQIHHPVTLQLFVIIRVDFLACYSPVLKRLNWPGYRLALASLNVLWWPGESNHLLASKPFNSMLQRGSVTRRHGWSASPTFTTLVPELMTSGHWRHSALYLPVVW